MTGLWPEMGTLFFFLIIPNLLPKKAGKQLPKH